VHLRGKNPDYAYANKYGKTTGRKLIKLATNVYHDRPDNQLDFGDIYP